MGTEDQASHTVESIMLFIVFFAYLSICMAQGPHDNPDWQDYKLEFGKVYSPEEDAKRYETCLSNGIEINLHHDQYNKTYTQAPNQFTDMTDEEFERDYSMKFPEEVLNGSLTSSGKPFVPTLKEIPASINWVEKGYVTQVENQGRCQSCYSFAASGALEGAWFKKHKKLVRLSKQQSVDCSNKWGNHGCHGGWYQQAWKYAMDVGGIQDEASYPYENTQSWCRFKKENVAATVSSYHDTTRRDEGELTQALAEVGPIAIAVDASKRSFRSYRTGVYYEPACSWRHLTHAVLAVGYGTENGQDYYLVKNTWGTRFGMGGYIKMARNKDNHCGIASRPSYPIV